MAFDESLTGRIRDALARKKNIEEKKMFGDGPQLELSAVLSLFQRRGTGGAGTTAGVSEGHRGCLCSRLADRVH